MIKALHPRYYVYFVDTWNMKGLMEFKTKGEMNLWIQINGKNCSYMKVISGFTLEERRQDEDRAVDKRMLSRSNGVVRLSKQEDR